MTTANELIQIASRVDTVLSLCDVFAMVQDRNKGRRLWLLIDDLVVHDARPPSCYVLLVVYERKLREALKLITAPSYLHCVSLLAYEFIWTLVVFAYI